MALKDYKDRYEIIEGYINNESEINKISNNLKNIILKGDANKVYLFFKQLFYEDISNRDAEYLYGLLITGDYIKNVDKFVCIYRRKALVGFLATCRKLEIVVAKNQSIA